ncbi:MAG: hypothetical protein OEW32_17585 [Nitrospira sp.]|nr:hypothetical protein [Nitrospira sp.]
MIESMENESLAKADVRTPPLKWTSESLTTPALIHKAVTAVPV